MSCGTYIKRTGQVRIMCKWGPRAARSTILLLLLNLINIKRLTFSTPDTVFSFPPIITGGNTQEIKYLNAGSALEPLFCTADVDFLVILLDKSNPTT